MYEQQLKEITCEVQFLMAEYIKVYYRNIEAYINDEMFLLGNLQTIMSERKYVKIWNKKIAQKSNR